MSFRLERTPEFFRCVVEPERDHACRRRVRRNRRSQGLRERAAHDEGAAHVVPFAAQVVALLGRGAEPDRSDLVEGARDPVVVKRAGPGVDAHDPESARGGRLHERERRRIVAGNGDDLGSGMAGEHGCQVVAGLVFDLAWHAVRRERGMQRRQAQLFERRTGDEQCGVHGSGNLRRFSRDRVVGRGARQRGTAGR